MNLEQRADRFIRGFFAMAHGYMLEPQTHGFLVGVPEQEIFLIHALGELRRVSTEVEKLLWQKLYVTLPLPLPSREG